jgi:hypothetical protein
MCNVLFSYACTLTGQVFIYRYIFMAMYSFVPPFREVKFCGVLSCVIDILGCAAGEKSWGTLFYNILLWTQINNTLNAVSSQNVRKLQICNWKFSEKKWMTFSPATPNTLHKMYLISNFSVSLFSGLCIIIWFYTFYVCGFWLGLGFMFWG